MSLGGCKCRISSVPKGRHRNREMCKLRTVVGRKCKAAESRRGSRTKIKFSGCADRSGIQLRVRPGDVFAPGRKFKGHFFDPDLHF